MSRCRPALDEGTTAAAASGAATLFSVEVCLASGGDASDPELLRGDARVSSGDRAASATAAGSTIAICAGVQYGQVSVVAQLREAMGIGGAPTQVRRRLSVACSIAAAMLGTAAAMRWLRSSDPRAEDV
jgi:hypothetical protein